MHFSPCISRDFASTRGLGRYVSRDFESTRHPKRYVSRVFVSTLARNTRARRAKPQETPPQRPNAPRGGAQSLSSCEVNPRPTRNS